MKSQFRCILFALLAVPAACGGDRSPSAASSGTTVPVAVTPPPAVITPEVTPEVKPAPMALAPGALPTSFAEALAQGKALAAGGDHARARELLEAAVKLDKKSAEPHIELARLYIATGERGLAIAAAGKAVKLAPESSQAYNTLGRAELARFNYDNAIAAFEKAVEINVDNVWAWNNLGLVYLQLKRYDDAVDALVHATTRKAVEGYMWNNLGTAYEQLDRLGEARAAFENGGKLGSKEALASRKRLEGVKTIVVMKTDKPEPAKPDNTKGYELSEPMPEVAPEPASEVNDAADDDAVDGTEKAAPDGKDGKDGKPVPAAEPPKAPTPL